MSMNNQRLADNFSNGATKGKGSNMFIEGDTIYSYGHHFPIAKRLSDGTYLLNTDSYSSSTARHVSHMQWSLYHDRVINVKGCDIRNAREQINIDAAYIKQVCDKLMSARTEGSRDAHERNITTLEHNITELETLL